MMSPPLSARLTVDTAALVRNWRVFRDAGAPAECGAAIKADGYGLGAAEAALSLVAAGCRDLFVAHWAEAAALPQLPRDVRVAVLHGACTDEMPAALASRAVPVLVSPAQVRAWRETGRACDVMVDTGLNRLGLSADDAVSGLLDGLQIDTLHSHLACAEDASHPLNQIQRTRFAALAEQIPARRYSLANSGGVGLGADFHFDLTRIGIGLYGGGAAPDGTRLSAVASISARVLQRRDVPAGDSVGYGATFVAQRPTRLAVVALGYADGYARSLSNSGSARIGGSVAPVAGRVAMDLTAFDITDAPPVAEGDWLDIEFDLAATARAAGRSEYELLTSLGHRYARIYR